MTAEILPIDGSTDRRELPHNDEAEQGLPVRTEQVRPRRPELRRVHDLAVVDLERTGLGARGRRNVDRGAGLAVGRDTGQHQAEAECSGPGQPGANRSVARVGCE